MKLCEKDFREVVEKLPNPVWISDKEGFKTYFNEAWYKLTGRDLKENLGEGWISSVHPEDVERILALYLESIKNRKEFIFEYRIERTDGEHRWVRESGVPFFNEKNEYLGFLGSCVDLTERRESVRAFPMTDSDVLTGLLSKDRFRSLLLQEIERATRYDSLLSVICIDLDRFGEVNELFGFEQGNEVLRLIGDMVLYNIRGIDLACRYTGDIFILALPETSIYEAEIVAERIREAIETSTVMFDDRPVRLRASIGLSQFSEGTSMDNLLENAQRAKEHARKIGGNRIQKLSLF